MTIANIKVNLKVKIEKVLIHPLLFAKLEQTDDLVYNYEDDSYLIFGKYPAVIDSNVDDIEFKFDLTMEDVITNKVINTKGEINIIK